MGLSLLERGIKSIQTDGFDRTFLLTIRYISSRIRYQDRISRLPPKLASSFSTLTTGCVRRTVRTLHRWYPTKYTDADPYRVLHVDPDDITHISGLHDRKRRGWVVGGDWDQNCDLFLEKPIPQSIHAHYEQGVPWEETPLANVFSDLEKFNQKCSEIERLHDNIAQHGFRSQNERLSDSKTDAWQTVNTTIGPSTDEITVDISRNGELLWNMLGKHRLSVSKVLDVDSIPVLVFARHAKWQEIRTEIKDADRNKGVTVAEKYGVDVPHPDLSDLI